MANIYDMADTWNDGLTTFTAIKMTVTQSAAASGSLLLDLQHGTSGSEASKFSVSSLGTVVSTSYRTGGARYDSTFLAFNNLDSVISHKGTGNLRLGLTDATTPVAQTLSVQSVTGVDNTVGPNFTIEGSQGTGSGGGGSIIFKVAPADTTPGNDGVQNTLATAMTLKSAGYWDFQGSILNGFQINNGSFLLFYVNSSNSTQIGGTHISPRLDNGTTALGTAPTGGFNGGWSNLYLHTNAGIRFNDDTKLFRDDANKLALRNGAAAQTFNIYNTFTDASNYERGFMRWNSNVLEIGTEAAGSGTLQGVKILGGNTSSSIIFDENDTIIDAYRKHVFRYRSSDIFDFFTSATQFTARVQTSLRALLGGTTAGQAWNEIRGDEVSSDPIDPPEGQYALWMSDGTGSGDDGDIMMKITAGGVTKTATIVDFSTI